MKKAETIREMLTIADKINAIVTDMKARKEQYLADMHKSAA